jgi:nitrilase
VFLDREATIDKACELIATAGSEGARLIVFPEALIPFYPNWVWAIPSGEEDVLNELYAELLSNSVTIPSDATDRLCWAAKLANAYIVMGRSERNVEASGASLYITLLYIDAQGKIGINIASSCL